MPGHWVHKEEQSCICCLLRNCIKGAPAESSEEPTKAAEPADIARAFKSPRPQSMAEPPVPPFFSNLSIDVAIEWFSVFIANSIVTPPPKAQTSYFDTKHPEAIHSSVRNIDDYVKRLAKYSAQTMPSLWSGEVLCIAAIYMRRVAHSYGGLTKQNMHRFVAIAIWVASKFHLDLVVKTSEYSQISGISVDEIRRCESDFLTRIDFRLCVNKEEYASACAEWAYLASLQRRRAGAVLDVLATSK